jgi:hypothetical protein
LHGESIKEGKQRTTAKTQRNGGGDDERKQGNNGKETAMPK